MIVARNSLLCRFRRHRSLCLIASLNFVCLQARMIVPVLMSLFGCGAVSRPCFAGRLNRALPF